MNEAMLKPLPLVCVSLIVPGDFIVVRDFVTNQFRDVPALVLSITRSDEYDGRWYDMVVLKRGQVSNHGCTKMSVRRI